MNVEALNIAIKDLPADRMRMHVCWGSTLGPHHGDVPLKDIVDIVLKAKPMAVSFPGANPRHGHEWKVWKDVKLPDGKAIIPGVIDSTSNFVEHPELVADRIVQYAGAVGPRERHRRRRLRLRHLCRPRPGRHQDRVDEACLRWRRRRDERASRRHEQPLLAGTSIAGSGFALRSRSGNAHARYSPPQSQRLGHDPEHLGVVDLAAHALAAGTGRGQDHVLAGMHAGVAGSCGRLPSRSIAPGASR